MKTILLLLLSACWLPMQAQDTYHPMVVEGKVWNMIQTNYDWSMEAVSRIRLMEKS